MWKVRKEPDYQTSDKKNRYKHSIPSRIFIIKTLEKLGASANYTILCRALGVTLPAQKEVLRFRLKAMIRDGQLLEARTGTYRLMSKMNLITGRIQGNKEGFGFLIPDEGGEDYYLYWKEMLKVFDGDKAVIREIGIDRKGRKEGQIVEVIERNTSQLVGRFYKKYGNTFVVPENTRINREILIKPGPLIPSHDQYVLIEILEQPSRKVQPVGFIKEILGDRKDAGMEVDVAVRTYNIPHKWPLEVEDYCNIFTESISELDKKNRVDLRTVHFVTIDGEDTWDFDDAVFCKIKKSGWRLYVAISDVSHYVQPGTVLDKEAYKRGTSVYFPGHVISMLPEILSNGLCSLHPKMDRLVIICEMTISAQGKISDYKFYEGLIRSHARLTYTQVWEMITQPLSNMGKILHKQYQSLVPHIKELYNLYKVLKSIRSKRGTIDFEMTETQIIFGKNRKIEKIVPALRNDAHKLIEEYMLCANVCAAKFLKKHKLPGLYRVHGGPTIEKQLHLNKFISTLGLSLPKGKLKSVYLQSLLASVKERSDYKMIQTVVLRSMSQAFYTTNNQGHFGLAFDEYVHFTSPIRRYPDLLIHRAIRRIIRSFMESQDIKNMSIKEINDKIIYPYDDQTILSMGEHCSSTERRADEATRYAIDWLKCEYMQERIGHIYSGIITAVTSFGLFVALTDMYIEGLVHVTSLPGDYYHYDNIQHRLVGEKTGKSYCLGDDITVIVVNVKLNDQKIDFELSNKTLKHQTKKIFSHLNNLSAEK